MYLVPIDGTTASSRSSRRVASSATFIDPAQPDAADRLAGLVADADRGRGTSPRHWSNYADVWNLIDYPRLLFNTIALALIGMVGTLALVHARGVWLRAVPVPGPGPAVHAAASPRSSCPRR